MSGDREVIEHVIAGINLSIAETLQLIQRKEKRTGCGYKRGRNRLARLLKAKERAKSDLAKLSRTDFLVTHRMELEDDLATAMRES